jgi:hypothetical protein
MEMTEHYGNGVTLDTWGQTIGINGVTIRYAVTAIENGRRTHIGFFSTHKEADKFASLKALIVRDSECA